MYTKQSLKADLAAMGLAPTDAVMVHSSMKSIGEVEGRADTVIDAFMEYFSDGLFMTPTHTWRGMKPGAVFDPAAAPVCVGIIPELFRKRPGVVRSLHPSHSIAAWGRGAADYIAGEENATTPCPPDGCWGRLRGIGAKILLLGVGHNRNTYIHSVEESLNIPDRLGAPIAQKILLPDGTYREIVIKRHCCSKIGDVSSQFPKLADVLEYHGAAKRTKFGDADCILCDTDKIYTVCEKIFKIEPDAILDRETIPEEWWKN